MNGRITFKYGKLGEVIENIRTFALPFENQTYTFAMQYKYDSWNRIQEMTYPDGERVRYGYNLGGMLCRVAGQKDGRSYRYIDSIHYNRFELKEGVWYGNGTRVTYDYDSLQRLSRLQSACADGAMQDIAYTYDSVGNIQRIENGAGTLSNGLGGTYSSNYEYDDLYRLTGSTGTWAGSSALNYRTTAQYHANGRISRKNLAARTLLHGIADTVNYARGYSYAEAQPNTLVQVSSGRWDEGALMVTAPEELQFVWDATGNLTRQQLVGDNQRFLCWDEQNRLQGVKDNRYLSYYQYDANGDRTYKLTGKGELQNISGNWQYYYLLDNATLYASPYLVATDRGYTKHYYAESERIASRIGGGGLGDALGSRLVDEESFSAHQAASAEHFDAVTYCLGADAQPVDDLLLFLYDWRDSVHEEKECYWYHPDHLGSSSWITFTDGKAVQHLHYLPWGEDYVNQRTTDFSARYTFSAKEKDSETGLSYFGSRYYSSDLSIWLSVDPMSDKYPSLSNYAYCRNNPIRLIDPNGMFDSEARATKFREKAVKKYGEDRVSDVYNNTYGEGKANYSFSIYGEGKNKYSRDGGTNEYGGPIITCDKSDIVVSSGKDFRSYNKSHRSKYGIRIEASISLGAQVGDYIDVKRHKLGFDVNISSVDVARLSISKEGNQPVDFDSHIISPDATQHNIGFSVGPISYEHNRNYYFNDLVSEKQTVSVFGYNLHSSDPSEIASAKFGMRLGIGFDIKINLTKK